MMIIKHRINKAVDLKNTNKNSAHSLSETPGIISSEGIFLSGNSYWYPWFGEYPVIFKMNVQLPRNWDLVSQGKRLTFKKNSIVSKVIWVCLKPQNEIYLIGGKFTSYKKKINSTEAMVFLRKPEEELANKYLEVTFQYIEMYEKHIPNIHIRMMY